MNKSLSLVTAMSALVLSAPVLHAAPGDNIARLKVINIHPDVNSDVAGLDIDDNTTAEIGITHFITSNLALDLGLSYAKLDVNLNGNDAGSTKIMPVNLTAHNHFI